MQKTLDQIVDSLKPIIQGMASSAKMPEYVFFVVDEGIAYFHLEYAPEKGGVIANFLGTKLRVKDLLKERIWRRAEYRHKNLADFVYEEAIKIVTESQKGKPEVIDDDKVPDIAVICFSNRIHNVLNRGARSIDSSAALYPYRLKTYEKNGQRFEFRLYNVNPGSLLETAKKISGRYGGLVKYPMLAGEIFGYFKSLIGL